MKEGVPLEFRKRTSDSWGWKSSTFQGGAKEKEGGGEREDPRVAKGVVLRKCLKIQRTLLLYIYVWKTDCKCRVTIEKRDCWWKEVLEEEGGNEIDILAEGLLPLWDRQERREAGGRSWVVKKLSPKDVGLSKLLDKDSAKREEGVTGWRMFETIMTRFFREVAPAWASLIGEISHIWWQAWGRDGRELRRSSVYTRKAKEMRRHLRSQHFIHCFTGIRHQGCDFDKILMVSGSLRNPHPLVTQWQCSEGSKCERVERWAQGSEPDPTPSLPWCFRVQVKQGFPPRTCLGRWMDGFRRSEPMWIRHC